MNSKDRVREFMREKDRIIFENTKLHIFDEELFNETITEDTCKEMLLSSLVQCDADMCPWCVQHSPFCVSCEFGAKYKICDREAKSRYSKILNRSNSCCIMDFKGMQDVINKYFKVTP